MSELVELHQRISALFELMNLEIPSIDTDLFEIGVLDSMTFVQLMVHLERELGLVVSLDQLEPENFRSIQHIALFVRSNQPVPEPAPRPVLAAS